MSSTEEAMYKKRIKTTGMSGQLYETELVGFALFKLLHDEQIEYFYLASNLDEIGCFDDLCFKAKIRGIDRPLLVFIQAKHKDNDNAYVDFDEAKHFHDSYSRVVQKFYLNANDKKNKDKIFIGNFEDYECVFILYTNGKYKNDSGIDYESAYSSVLNDLISTGRNGTKLHCTDQILEDLVEAVLKVEIEALAKNFTKFLSASQSMQMMLDDDVKRYHVVLALHAVNVSSKIYFDEKKPDFKWRIMTFREDFFTSSDKNLTMLKKAMFNKILQNHAISKNKKPTKDPVLEERLQTFFKEPCLNTLEPLIGICIVYKNEKLEFASQRTESEKEMLKQIKLSQDIIEKAEAIVARNILLSPELKELKVPVTFGNTDLIIAEKRIIHLTKNIVDLYKKVELENGRKIVTLDETVDPGILNINGGLGGTVGNLLVYEESTKLLKFVDDSTSLRNNAQQLFEKLKKGFAELDVYRFYVNPVLLFPVLSFDSDNGIAGNCFLELECLADHFTKFLSASQSMQMMFDDVVKRYHVVLALHVVHVSIIFSDEKNPGLKWRIMTFREDFFTSSDKNLTTLRKTMFNKILQNHAISKNENPTKDSKLEEQLQTFFEEPCLNTLRPLIGICIVYKNEKLEFASQRTESEKELLKQIKLSHDVIEEAEAIVARNILLSPELRELKVPVTFGNTDLMISERRITDLSKNIVALCKKNELDNGRKIVTLDETVDPEILNINEGLGGTVGNLLVYEESTKLFKFVDDSKSLQNNAQLLFETLINDFAQIHVYRFYVKPMLPFPVLSFDCDSGIARKISNKLVIYAGQSDQKILGTKLKKLIEDYQKAKYPNMQVQAESLFQNYHSNIQTWSLIKAKGPYLTKDSKTYQEALNNIFFEPQMSSLRSTFHMTKMKHIEYSTESLKTLQSLSRQKDEEEELKLAELAVIDTDVAILTAIKVIQYLRSYGVNSYSIIDLECLLKLPTEDICALKSELKKTEKVLLVLCHNLQGGITWYEKYLKEIAETVKGKRKIVMTNSIYVDMVQNAFLSGDKENTKKEMDNYDIVYEKHSLLDLTQESQKDVMENSNILFQGQLTSLDLFLDETSMPFIEGVILNKIVFNETIEIGELHSDVNYDEISHLYQDRTVEYIKHNPIPGRISLSSTVRIHAMDNSQASSSNNFPSNQRRDQLVGSIFSVTNTDSGLDENPFSMYFNFDISLNSDKNNDSQDNVILIVVLNEKGVSRFRIKTKNLTKKVWNVKVTLFDDSMQLKYWLKGDSVLNDTLETLRYVCQGVVLNDIILNEDIVVIPTDNFSASEKDLQCFSYKEEVFENNSVINDKEKDHANNVTENEFPDHITALKIMQKNDDNNIPATNEQGNSDNNINVDHARSVPDNNASEENRLEDFGTNAKHHIHIANHNVTKDEEHKDSGINVKENLLINSENNATTGDAPKYSDTNVKDHAKIDSDYNVIIDDVLINSDNNATTGDALKDYETNLIDHTQFDCDNDASIDEEQQYSYNNATVDVARKDSKSNIKEDIEIDYNAVTNDTLKDSDIHFIRHAQMNSGNNIIIDDEQKDSKNKATVDNVLKDSVNHVKDYVQIESENNVTMTKGQEDSDNNAIVESADKDTLNAINSYDTQKDFVKSFRVYFERNFFQSAPDISFVANDQQDESFIRDNQEKIHNNDNVTDRDVCLDESISKCEETAHNFQINFRSSHRIVVKTFDDLKDGVVLLTAKAGLGKSTILTHLSRKINKLNQHVWVVRINLLNYSGEFRKWQRLDQNKIGTLITLSLIVQAVFKNVTVDLKEDSGNITFENCSGDEWVRFNLKMFLNYYENGKLLFIFDGFDEICPDYKNEVLLLLSVVKNDPHKNKMWITSRPYNAILPDLEQRFGKSFRLEYLNKTEQTEYLRRFWDKSVEFKEVSNDLLESLLTILSKVILVVNIKLKIICYYFYKYLVAKFPIEYSDEIKKTMEVIEKVNETVTNDINSEDNEFMGTPLLLHLIAGFFVTHVLDFRKLTNAGRITVITMYEWFIQTKLIKILFIDKYAMNIDIPYVKDRCEAELKQSLAMYKKFGVQAIFGNPIFVRYGLNLEEFNDLAPFNFDTESGTAEFKAAIDRIWNAKDKTGLISYVTDEGTPVFIHKTFAEYFAVEYISDILKREDVPYETKKLVMTVMLSIILKESVVDDRGELVSRGSLGNWVREKCIADEEYMKIGADIVKKEPFIDKYNSVVNTINNNTLRRAYVRLINSTADDYEDPSFKECNIEEYLSGKRQFDDDLFHMMKPHFRSKFSELSKCV